MRPKRTPVVVRVRRTLRSPRVAAWLILAFTLYVFVAVLVPQRALDERAVAEWAERNPALSSVTEAVGLHQAYTHPVFIVLVVLLTVSTSVCAWERTSRALRVFRRRGKISEETVRSARASRVATMFLDDDDDPDRAYRRAGKAIGALRLRIRSGPRVTEGESGAVGLLGSPIFHWALVGLILAVSFGSLTRAEGLIGIVAGYEKPDFPDQYGVYSQGPLSPGTSGLLIGVEPDIPLDYEAGGIVRGSAPMVYLRDGEEIVARGRVYPNSPLRYGSVMVHNLDDGLGVAGSLLTAQGEQPVQYLIDRDESVPNEWVPAQATYETLDGSEMATLSFAPAIDVTGKVDVVVSRPGEVPEQIRAGVGDVVEIAEDTSLRIDHLGQYARLYVVRDSSLAAVYTLLIVASLAVGVSVLVPYRTVWLIRGDREGREVVTVTVRHSRGDRGFRDRVIDSLREEGFEVEEA